MLGFPTTPVTMNPPQTMFAFEFLQLPPSPAAEEHVVLDADVVIVGSGCGGAVAAKTLAEAGMRVLVVDRGYYWNPQHFPMSEQDAAVHLFGNGGAWHSDDGIMTIINRAVWGGGGTVNWSASLQTQGYVRREWSDRYGLPHFTHADFQADLDAVCDRMGVGIDSIEHDAGNRALLEGARKLGWAAKPVPQNTGSEAHNCGHCTLSCASCGKKGPTESFLVDAARAGATFLEGFQVQHVTFADDDPTVATGVRGVWTSRDRHGGTTDPHRTTRPVIVRASRVILSAGALATPLILHRSGITNPHVGRHLHLHPVSLVAAEWDADTQLWHGPILTSVVTGFENLDGRGHGVKLEPTTMLPSLFLSFFPWRSGADWKAFVPAMRRMTGYISLARDARPTHRVSPDPADPARPRISGAISALDRAHILKSVVRLAQLLYVQGARALHTSIPTLPPFRRPAATATPSSPPSLSDPAFQAWLQALRSTGLRHPDVGFASAYQMGSCRMAPSARAGAADPSGAVWGCQGVWIADSSVLPSASGVNPMVTTCAIARGVARGVARRWRVEKGKGGARL